MSHREGRQHGGAARRGQRRELVRAFGVLGFVDALGLDLGGHPEPHRDTVMSITNAAEPSTNAVFPLSISGLSSVGGDEGGPATRSRAGVVRYRARLVVAVQSCLVSDGGTRWSGVKGWASNYDDRWAQLVAQGKNIHGEADFVESLSLAEPMTVLDAGCGTGRVAIELARRGHDVMGVDLDAAMLEQARAKAPQLEWIHGDVAEVELGRRFNVVVLAGNVMIFLAPGTEAAVQAMNPIGN